VTSAFLLALALGAPTAPPSYAIHPLGSLAHEPAQVERVERAATDALATLPNARIVPRADVRAALADRTRTRLPPCEGDIACLTEVGRALRVDRIISGEVGGLAPGLVIYLKLVDVASGRELASAQASSRSASGDSDALAREAIIKLVAPERYVGRLEVHADVAGATLYIDGQRAADLPAPPQPLLVGTHALRVTHPSHRDVLRFVEITFDQTTSVDANLTALPIVTEELRARGGSSGGAAASSGPSWYQHWWVVAAFGVVVAGGACAAVFTTVNHADSDIHTHLGPPR
jgi:hypothetical protein